jgi:hypothetical protein
MKEQSAAELIENLDKTQEPGPATVKPGRDTRRAVWVPEAGHAWNPLRNWPPNEKCFCNSGKKAKKCCLPKEPGCVSVADAEGLAKAMKMGTVGLEAIRREFQRHRDVIQAARKAEEERRASGEALPPVQIQEIPPQT